MTKQRLKDLAPCQGIEGLEAARRIENCLNDHYRIKEADCDICTWRVKRTELDDDPYATPAKPEKDKGLFE